MNQADEEKPPQTGVCVVRVEQQGPGRSLITVMADTDIYRISAESRNRVLDAESVLSLVADFLRDCSVGSGQS